MPFVNAIACVRLPTVATISRCCKRFYLLGLCMLLIAMLLGTATWAIINFSATRALIPLIVVNILLSMFEGALVLAILQATNNKPLDDDSHELPTLLSHPGPPKPSPIHPAFRDFNNGSLNSPRNFSFPRESCLDITTPGNAPATVPDSYVATGMIPSDSKTHRPLPPLPVKSAEAPAPPTHLLKVNDVTSLPLSIHKRESTSDETAANYSKVVADVKTVEEPAPELGYFDKTPYDPAFMSEAEKVITGLAAEQQCEEEVHAVDDEAESNPLESPANGPQTPQKPIHLLAPVIVIQQATPTTPKPVNYPTAATSGASTIRLVSQYLEIPTKAGHDIRRK